MSTVTRRMFSTLLLAHTAGALAQVTTDRRLRIGSSMPLTGPLAANAKLFESGARLCFDRVNQQGGVHGARIDFEVLDDGFVPAQAKENSRVLIAEREVLVLFGNPGTAQVAAALTIASQTGTPLFGPATGSRTLRRQHVQELFHVRASYRDELQRILQHAKTVGYQRIGLFHTDDALGKVVLEELQDVAKSSSTPLVGIASASIRDGNLPAAAKELSQHRPQAIVMGTIGSHFAKFVAAYKAAAGQIPQIYGLSLMDPGVLSAELADAARGIVLTQIMPSVRNMTLPVVREYRDSLAKARPAADPTILELDAFVNAKILVEGLKRAGRTPTRAGLIAALEGLGRYDAGGYVVTYGRDNHNGSNFVDLAILGANGKLSY